MRKLPILFNSKMIRAIFAGTKTQTRRTVPDLSNVDGRSTIYNLDNIAYAMIEGHGDVKLPYAYSDELWVRETFCKVKGQTLYKADEWDGDFKWRGAIHMPMLEARLWLKIESVRIEYLNSISETDAGAEGVFSESGQTHREAFKELWDSIYPGDWEENPRVVAYTFKVLEK